MREFVCGAGDGPGAMMKTNPQVVVKEAHKQFRLDAVAAWEHYERTGLHLTQEEADAWLTKLAMGEDAELPPCHTGAVSPRLSR